MIAFFRREQFTAWRGRARVALILGLAVGALSACGDDLLEVDLPAQLTDDVLEDPKGAETQINTIIAHFEEGYNMHTDNTFGREGGGEVHLCGPNCDFFQFTVSNEHFPDFATSFRFATGLHEKLATEWTVEQVPQREEFLAISSIYEGASLAWMGMNLCEAAIAGGPLQTADQVTSMAEDVLTRAVTEIDNAGDFALPNGISSSAKTMTHGLRAQVRWMAGDEAGALADAEQVPMGFVAYVTRESNRRNYNAFNRNQGGFLELYDPIDWWVGGTNPATGEAWPDVIPFTGYTFLGILPDGRAVHENGIPVRTQGTDDVGGNSVGVEASAVRDTRVTHTLQEISGKQAVGYSPTRYAEIDDDIPLVNWKEMWLIRAEIEGGQTAIDLVNDLRAADGLPLVTYVDPADEEAIRYMIIEERRRALFLEARYYYTKLKNTDLLWFPRAAGGTRAQGHTLEGGVRTIMPADEFVFNENLTTADRGTGCDPNQAPVQVDVS